MPRLFVDLDGVLADWEAGAASVLGMTPGDFQELHGAAVMWKALEAHPDFYRRLPWMADGAELWAAVNDKAIWPGPRPMILSGTPLGEWSQPQKLEWVVLELGIDVPLFLCMSIDKARFCCEGDVLIDDREAARLDWETAGGVFIHHTSAAETIAQLQAMLQT